MQTSDVGRRFIENEEGKRNDAYPDPGTGGSPWTIGYGHTGPDVYPGLHWTDQQCDDMLTKDLRERFEPPINSLVKVRLEQHQFDALDSLEYNIGVGAFAHSTLLKKLNAGDYQGAADQFLVWCIPDMLKPRRARERAMFLNDPGAEYHRVVTPTTADVQRTLGLPADGIYGPHTKAAVMVFQHDHGLDPDGIAGPKTLTALGLL